jgi:transposase
MSQGFWLSDAQWERLAPLLPNKPRGVQGWMTGVSSAVSWLHCNLTDAGSMCLPSVGRARRSTTASCAGLNQGVWQTVFETLAAAGGPPAAVLLASTHVKAHRCAAGGRGLQSPGSWRQPWWTQHQNSRLERRPRTPIGFPADGWPTSGLPRGRSAVAQACAVDPGHGRPSLRHQCHPPADRKPGCRPEHPVQANPPVDKLLQPGTIPGPQRYRAHVLQAEGLSPHRDTLRQARIQLSQRSLPRRRGQLLVMSPDPSG